MKKLIISLLSCTLMFTSFAQAADTAATSTKSSDSLTKSYENKEKKYGIDYPETWQKKDVPSLDFVLFAPPKDSSKEIHASMNVIAEKTGSEVTLDKFYNESVANLKSELKDVKIDGSGDRTISGIPSKWIVYTHVMQEVKFEVIQYFLAANDSVYLLTFSSIADDFNTYRPTFDSIAGSFHLLKDKSEAPAPTSTPVPATPAATPAATAPAATPAAAPAPTTK